MWADKTLCLAEAQGYLYNVAFAKVVKGWACVESDAAEAGLALIQQGLAMAGALGAKLDQPFLLALSAEAQAACGHYSAALDVIAEALSLVQASRTFFYEAELYRLKAAVVSKMNARNAADAPGSDLKIALDVARRQGAKSLELRAASDLARLLAEHDRGRFARETLKPLYASFEEGFETRDLREAGNLLGTV